MNKLIISNKDANIFANLQRFDMILGSFYFPWLRSGWCDEGTMLGLKEKVVRVGSLYMRVMLLRFW